MVAGVSGRTGINGFPATDVNVMIGRFPGAPALMVRSKKAVKGKEWSSSCNCTLGFARRSCWENEWKLASGNVPSRNKNVPGLVLLSPGAAVPGAS